MQHIISLLFLVLFVTGCNSDRHNLCMVGDSHMKQGKWDSFGIDAYNFGVGGATIAECIGQARRLRTYKPGFCFIECGANDIDRDSTYVQMTRDYKKLLDTMSMLAIPIAVKVLYVAKNYPGSDTFNIMAAKMNKYIDGLGIETIDPNRLLSTDGYLNEKYNSGDNIHLNAEGYKQFAHAVNCWVYRWEMNKWYNRILLM